jgi:hypothetical protein
MLPFNLPKNHLVRQLIYSILSDIIIPQEGGYTIMGFDAHSSSGKEISHDL